MVTMKQSIITGITLLLGWSAAANAALYTVMIDTDAEQNLLSDPGFESIAGTEPDAASTPWFTTGEGSAAHFATATNVAKSGSQSVGFLDYADNGAIVQTLNVQVDPAAYYNASIWMLTSEPSGGAGHTNTPALNASIFTSPTLGGTYTYRTGFFFNQENSASDVWEQFTGTIDGSTLSAYAGEFIQIRFVKANANASHRMYIDDAVVTETETRGHPKAVTQMAMGTGLVYSWEADSLFADGQISHILKDIGVGTLRWPGGTVVTYYHWDALTGNGWSDSWDPTYNPANNKPPEDFMDLDEYLALTDETGAEIMLGVNMSSGKEWGREAEGIAEAQALMQYCYDAGYDVKYVYLDNESYHGGNQYNSDPNGDGKNWTPTQYGKSFKDYAAAIKTVYPDAKLIANWNNDVKSSGFQSNMATMFSNAEGTIDYVDVHLYWQWNSGDWAIWKSQLPMKHNPGYSYESTITYANDLFATLGYPDTKVAVMEWNLGPGPWQTNSVHNNFKTALMQSEMQLQFLRGGLDIGLMYALHSPNVSPNEDKHILYGAAPNSTALWMWLFSKTIGKTVVQSSSPVAGIYILTAMGSEGELVTYLLNKTDTDHNIEFDVSGTTITDVSEAWRFKDDGTGKGTLQKIGIWEVGGKKRTTLQANTVNMIGFNYADADADGIDDGWEIKHFGSISTADSTSDADGDGVSDHDEALAHTDPNDPLSYLAIRKFTASAKPPAGLLIGWDTTTGSGGDYSMPGIAGELLMDQAYALDATAGSADGAFGSAISGTAVGAPAYAVRTVTPGSTDTLGIQIQNTSELDLQLDALHFDYSPFFGAGPRDITLIYAGGDLSVTTGTVVNKVSGVPVNGKTGDYADFDWSLTNLTDSVLAPGETATFKLVASNAGNPSSSGGFDNVAVSGDLIGGDYLASLAWRGQIGKKYQVMVTTNLVSGAWDPATPLTDGTPAETTITISNDEAAFYRLDVAPY